MSVESSKSRRSPQADMGDLQSEYAQKKKKYASQQEQELDELSNLFRSGPPPQNTSMGDLGAHLRVEFLRQWRLHKASISLAVSCGPPYLKSEERNSRNT